MAGYWLKLYTEILEDPKYSRLSDNAKLGMYELMLVAKRFGDEGILPNVDDIAFYTRRQPEWWTAVLKELDSIHFITNTDDGCIIRKFSERQAPADGKTRAKMSREISHRNEFRIKQTACETHDVACETHGETETETETEGERESEESDSPARPLPELDDYVSVTSHTPEPPVQGAIIKAMQAIKRKDRVAYLKPIFAEWMSRGYNPRNIAWLTEWAITGVPANKHTTTAKPDKDDYRRFTSGHFGHIGEH